MRRGICTALASIISLASFLAPLPAFADNGTPHMRTGSSFTAPVGFQIFCLTNPAQCRGGGSSEISLTQAVLQTLTAVNAEVNRHIRPRGESVDNWSVGGVVGDCEDYVLAKRATLVAAGLPRSAIRIAIAKTRQGTGHAVLVVRTDQGDLVLDNLTSKIQLWHATGLRWVAISGPNPESWQSIV